MLDFNFSNARLAGMLFFMLIDRMHDIAGEQSFLHIFLTRMLNSE